MVQYDYSKTKQQLIIIDNLLSRKDKDIDHSIECRMVLDDLCSQLSNGKHCSSDASQAVIEYIPDGDERVVAYLLSEIRPKCRNAVELVVHLLAKVMQIADWKGDCIIADIPKLADPSLDYLDIALSNSLICAESVPGNVLDTLSDLLGKGDDDLDRAILLYIDSWCAGCNDDADISNFFPNLEQKVASDDDDMHRLIFRIRQRIKRISAERKNRE